MDDIPARQTAGDVLKRFGAAITSSDWVAVRALLADGAQMHYVHTDEWFGPDELVALLRDYPGDWTYTSEEIVDGGQRAVLHSRTVIGNDVSHCATFATLDGEKLTDLTEIWTDTDMPHPDRRTS